MENAEGGIVGWTFLNNSKLTYPAVRRPDSQMLVWGGALAVLLKTPLSNHVVVL